MSALTLEQRLDDAMAALEELRGSEQFDMWKAKRFTDAMDGGLLRFDVAITAAEARVRDLERERAAAASAPTPSRLRATRDEEVRRLMDNYPHTKVNYVDNTNKPHAGLKRQAERLTDIALTVEKARKVLPNAADEDVASLGAEHDGLRRALVATGHALEEGERVLLRQSRDLVWAFEHGWNFVEAMSAPDTQLTASKDEEKRYKELLELKRKTEAEAQSTKTVRASAGGRGGGRGNRWSSGRGRDRYHDWRERERYDHWGPRDDRWHGPGGQEHYHGGGRGGLVPPSYGTGRGGRGGRGGGH
jgi:hypothetical protein